jgi:hypothetical protein
MSEITLDLLFPGHKVGQFKPIAYYDKHMDCIRIELRDCSFTEVRISPDLTVLRDNYPDPSQDSHAGLMLKGAKHFFAKWEVPMDGVVMVTNILNQYLATLPGDREHVRPVQETASRIELAVDFREPVEIEEPNAVLT